MKIINLMLATAFLVVTNSIYSANPDHRALVPADSSAIVRVVPQAYDSTEEVIASVRTDNSIAQLTTLQRLGQGVAATGSVLVNTAKGACAGLGAAALAALAAAKKAGLDNEVRENAFVIGAIGAGVGATYGLVTGVKGLRTQEEIETTHADNKALAGRVMAYAKTYGQYAQLQAAAEQLEPQLNQMKLQLPAAQQQLRGIQCATDKLLLHGEHAITEKYVLGLKDFLNDASSLIERCHAFKNIEREQEKKDKAIAFMAHYQAVMQVKVSTDNLMQQMVDSCKPLLERMPTIGEIFNDTQLMFVVLDELDIQSIKTIADAYQKELQEKLKQRIAQRTGGKGVLGMSGISVGALTLMNSFGSSSAASAAASSTNLLSRPTDLEQTASSTGANDDDIDDANLTANTLEQQVNAEDESSIL